MKNNNIFIPADVDQEFYGKYLENYSVITKNKNRLFIFAYDQKIEHLNSDFYGSGISFESNDPEHAFRIAVNSNIGAFATQLGLIARYGTSYPNIDYIVKLNSKTNIIPTQAKDPLSTALWSIDDVLNFQKCSKLNIRAVGYTIYLGSKYENIMLNQAAQIIFNAHKNGLVTILWIYPRSRYIEDEKDSRLIAGAAGLANSLGSDFVKIQAPRANLLENEFENIKIITQAAGNTKVLCAGGEFKDEKILLKSIFDQINYGNTSGVAIGRNIFQRSEKDAVNLVNKISAVVYNT